jgi:molecular chaperone Hsp33
MSTAKDRGDVPPSTGDRVVRAITDDGAFRVIVARTTETVRGAVRAQGVGGATAVHFGELLTGGVLLREAMAPGLRVQAILKGAGGKGSLVADSHPDGNSRGLVNFGVGSRAAVHPEPAPARSSVPEGGSISRPPPAPEISLGQGALLQVMRTLPSGSLHQGVVEVPWSTTGALSANHRASGISGALMQYMQDSEQIVSTIAVASLVGSGGEVEAAGGYLVQLLPEVERGPLMVMTERLTDFTGLDEVLRRSDGSPDALLDELLYGMPFQRLSESRLGFGCQCSQVRVIASLATLPRADIEDLVKDGEVLEIRCDYCGKEYGVHPAQLRPLLTPS